MESQRVPDVRWHPEHGVLEEIGNPGRAMIRAVVLVTNAAGAEFVEFP
jgi:hypothetical protein